MKKSDIQTRLLSAPDFWEALVQLIVDEKILKIPDFGTFEHRSYGPRKFHNPVTGETQIDIPRCRIVFRASKNIFKKVDTGKK